MRKKPIFILLLILFSLTNIFLVLADNPKVVIDGIDPEWEADVAKQSNASSISSVGARISLWDITNNKKVSVMNFINTTTSEKNLHFLSPLTKVEIARCNGEYPQEIHKTMNKGFSSSNINYNKNIGLPQMVIEKGQSSQAFINNIVNWFNNQENINQVIDGFNISDEDEQKFKNSQMCLLVEPLVMLYENTTGILLWETANYCMFTCAEIGVVSYNSKKGSSNIDKLKDKDLYGKIYASLPYSCFKPNAGYLSPIPPYDISRGYKYCFEKEDFMYMIKSLGCFEVVPQIATKSEVVATPSEAKVFEPKVFEVEYYTNSWVISNVKVSSSKGFPRQSNTPRTNKDYDAKNGCLNGKLAQITYTFDSSERLEKDELKQSLAIPESGVAVSWAKWKCPSVPCTVVIDITTNDSDAVLEYDQIVANIIDPITGLYPPNAEANDRNDGFNTPSYATGEWDKGVNSNLSWTTYDYKWNYYWVWGCSRTMENGSLTEYGYTEHWDSDRICNAHECPADAENHVCPTGRCHDVKEDWGWVSWIPITHTLTLNTSNEKLYRSANSPDSNNSLYSIKSGYGVELNIDTSCTYKENGTRKNVSTIQNAVVPPQYMEAFLPEFNFSNYEITTFNDLDSKGYSDDNTFIFPTNPYSQYGQNCHFTPLWYPDGKYVIGAKISQCFCPAGMLSISLNNISININGSAYDDWHIAPQNK